MPATLSNHRLYHIEPFSPEPIVQGSRSARWCGKDGCGACVVRMGPQHSALPQTFPCNHADPDQSEGLSNEKYFFIP